MDVCYFCQPSFCCRGPSHLLGTEQQHQHAEHTMELVELTKIWGLGRVLQSWRGILGEYQDVETRTRRSVFLGFHAKQATGRMNHVKSFL